MENLNNIDCHLWVGIDMGDRGELGLWFARYSEWKGLENLSFIHGTDGNGIPDAVETMLSNSSHFMEFYNFTHDPNNSAMGLWNDYAWSIAYYFSLKLHKNWDDVYNALKSGSRYYYGRKNCAGQTLNSVQVIQECDTFNRCRRNIY